MKIYSYWPFRTERGKRLDTEKLRVDLRMSLMETILWCSPRADINNPESCLRSPAFRPYLFNDTRHDSVHDVVYERHRTLVNSGAIDDIGAATSFEALPDVRHLIPPHLGGGRLLVWFRDETIDDGVGELLTKGYLDVSDMPPWDTWVAYVSEEDVPVARPGYLVSWVPPAFVPSVGKAIENNAYDASFWLGDTKLLAARVLDQDGHLA